MWSGTKITIMLNKFLIIKIHPVKYPELLGIRKAEFNRVIKTAIFAKVFCKGC